MNINDEKNLTFVDTFAKLDSIMEEYKGKKIVVSYSGGSDSDTVMWLLRKRGYEVPAVFSDTGLEYEATWRQIEFMRKEGFQIEIIKAKKPIPISQREFGYAFLSKNVSEILSRLQHNNFDFQGDGALSYEELCEKYPSCKSALKWWTNQNRGKNFNVSWNSGLKEFLIEYGLPFKVSEKCCDWAKKHPFKTYALKNKIDLDLLGIRKAEGGIRSVSYKGCFIPAKSHPYSIYMPLFWWSNKEKEEFDAKYNIPHSDCYTKYGMMRTGCAGCPFGNSDAELLKEYEPKLYIAVNNIFKPTYEWTTKYNEFQKKKGWVVRVPKNEKQRYAKKRKEINEINQTRAEQEKKYLYPEMLKDLSSVGINRINLNEPFEIDQNKFYLFAHEGLWYTQKQISGHFIVDRKPIENESIDILFEIMDNIEYNYQPLGRLRLKTIGTEDG